MAEEFSNQVPQFGTAEYSAKAGDCHFCHQPIAGDYYRVKQVIACRSCGEKMRAALAKDTHAAYMRALLYGMGAAVAGMILYAVFEIVTGIIIGYISLAVGWMVGTAMMKGSDGVGGRRYQIAAVLLTYAAVSMAAIPVWIHYAGEQRDRQAERQQKQQQLEDEQRQLQSGSEQRNQERTPKPERPRIRWGTWIFRIALLGLASPFLGLWHGSPSFGWLIGLVILFVGMKIAAKIAAGEPVQIYGPFRTPAQAGPV